MKTARASLVLMLFSVVIAGVSQAETRCHFEADIQGFVPQKGSEIRGRLADLAAVIEIQKVVGVNDRAMLAKCEDALLGEIKTIDITPAEFKKIKNAKSIQLTYDSENRRSFDPVTHRFVVLENHEWTLKRVTQIAKHRRPGVQRSR